MQTNPIKQSNNFHLHIQFHTPFTSPIAIYFFSYTFPQMNGPPLAFKALVLIFFPGSQ